MTYDPHNGVTKSGYVNASGGREHAYVAAIALGRPLPRGWQVHHVNEVKNDNRPENLVVCQSNRLHFLAHAVPEILRRCRWLGEPGRSVRLLESFEPDGFKFCVACKALKPTAEFYSSKKYKDGKKGRCASCSASDAKAALAAFRATHPPKKPKPVSSPGEKNPAAKLSTADVVGIREAYRGGERQTALARRFGVSQSQISLIVLRKQRGHV